MNQTPQQEKVAAANAAAVGAAYGSQQPSVVQPTSPSRVSASAATGNSGSPDPVFDFSADHSQFDKRAQFNTPSPEQSVPQPSQAAGSSEQVNEAQSRENERIANEILKKQK